MCLVAIFIQPTGNLYWPFIRESGFSFAFLLIQSTLINVSPDNYLQTFNLSKMETYRAFEACLE